MAQETCQHRKLEGAARRPVVATSDRVTNQTSFGWSSSNWSGYAIASNTAGTYNTTSAEWKVPSVQAPSQPQPTSWWGRFMQWLQSLFGGGTTTSDSYSATWLGIDGFNDSSLIQTGTSQNVVGGQTQYYAWWEILPNAETTINPQQYPVSAGDDIIASIHQQTNGNWSISLGNRTKGWVFQKTEIAYSGPQTSVEWIVEAPMLGGQQTTLANYGQMTFTNCSVNGTDPHLQTSEAGAMVQNGQQVSTPSSPGPNGDSFTVQYGATDPNAPTS